MFIILFTIVVTTIYYIRFDDTVKNKTKDIAILKSIGVLNKSIKKFFY